MAWKHISDNEEAWLYFKEGLLYHGDPTGGMINYPDPYKTLPLYSWEYDEWMETSFDGAAYRKNYIRLED